jgi:predicted nucleotidyltransferase
LILCENQKAIETGKDFTLRFGFHIKGMVYMKTVAIICEYNPLTNGHVRHLTSAREQTGCDTVVCVMSGSFVQRGEAAITDKYSRASTAVFLGADIVVELPLIYAISPADNFAYGAIKTIAAFPDVEYISFGSECGDAELLTKVAMLLIEEPLELKNLLQGFLKDGYSFPKARALAVDEYAGLNENYSEIKGLLDFPNNILGIAYISAIIKAGLDIKIHTIKRMGAGYNDDAFDTEFPSATAIRSAIRQGDLAKIKQYVPAETFSELLQLNEQVKSSTDPLDSLSDMIIFKLKGMSGHDLEHYYDVSGGLNNRIKLAASTTTTLDQLLEAAKTKRYTVARLRRICLYALFDITKEMYEEAVRSPAYIEIIAISSKRKDILAALSESCRNVLTRFSDVNRVDKSLRVLVKLDFVAQGTLDIINRADKFNRKMIIV